MAISITFYVFAKKINSTARPSGGASFSCNLIEDCSTLNPNVVIAYDDNDSNPTAYNYAYIPRFGRYYWVNDWTYADRAWVASLSVDPLASWKSYIGSSEQYVTRAASEYDEYIVDSQYPTTADSIIVNTFGTRLWNADSFTEGVYIISVVGVPALGQAGSNVYYAMTPTEFKNFCNALYGFFNNSWEDVLDTIQQTFIRAFLNPIEYITSCRWYPFSLDNLITVPVSGIPTSFFEIPGISAHILGKLIVQNTFESNIQIPSHPLADERGKYLNSPHYAQYSFIVQPWGRLSLNPVSMVDGNTINLQTSIDISTGIGALQLGITQDEGNAIVTEYIMASVGIDVPLSQVTNKPLNALTDLVGIVGGLTSSRKSTGIGIVGDTLNGISSFADDLIPSPTTIGTVGGTMIGLSDAPKLESIFYNVTEDFPEHYGRPLCKRKTISSLSGYILCEGAELSAPCTSQELNLIISTMNGGFFYE